MIIMMGGARRPDGRVLAVPQDPRASGPGTLVASAVLGRRPGGRPVPVGPGGHPRPPGDHRRRHRLRRVRRLHPDRGVHRHAADRPGRRRLPPARRGRGPRVPRAGHDVGLGGDDDGRGQRPHRDLPRPRDHVHRPLRAGRLQPQAGRVGRGGPQVLRPRRVLVGHLPLRDRPHLRGHRLHQPAPDRRLPVEERRRLTTGCCSAGWPCCWWGSASRSPPCPSTCGRPTSTRARRRRSPGSWPRWPRPGPSPPCCGCSCPRSARCGPTGSPWSGSWPSSAWCSGRSWPWSSGTSSG